jgi:hypothetical protein
MWVPFAVTFTARPRVCTQQLFSFDLRLTAARPARGPLLPRVHDLCSATGSLSIAEALSHVCMRSQHLNIIDKDFTSQRFTLSHT